MQARALTPSKLEGPYVGQKPPSSNPKEFAPLGRSTEHRDHSGFFPPDMKTFYFTRKSHKDGKWSLFVFRSINNRWEAFVVGPRIGRPILTPDGKIMHLGKRYMELTDSGWSEVKSLGPLFEEFRIMQLTSSSKGTYYFDTASETDPIRYTRMIDGKRETPKVVDIDFGKWNAHPYIAPDESYLIWDEQDDNSYGGADLFISFRQEDDSWGPAINLGEKINTSASENGAIVTPDGKYLFFNRYVDEKNAGMYWVDAGFIETLRSQSLANVKKDVAAH